MTATLALNDAERATVLAILREHLPVCSAIHAFGSRANGTAKPWSDLDLVIDAGRPLPLETLAAMTEAFDESDLPWKVDIVDRANVDDAFGKLIDASKVELA